MPETESRIVVEPDAAELSDWLQRLSDLTRLQPDRIAVRGNDRSLSTGDLELEVRTLTRQLDAAGAGPGVEIAVCLDREPAAIVAFLAILRIGAAYLPLDPGSPASHLGAVLESVPEAIVLTSADMQVRLPGTGLRILIIGDRTSSSEAAGSGGIQTVPDHLPAYIMFTSGSTGAPQGVVVSRRALARYIAALDHAFGITEDDVYLHTASFSFSASTRQLLAPLAAGATLAIASEKAKRDPFLLLESMQAWRVTVWDTVPSVWRVVEQVLSRVGARDEDVEVTDSLRLVLLTGEPLRWDLVHAWHQHLPPRVEVMNLYSQTETAGTVSAFKVPADGSAREGLVPLGETLPGVELLLLDEDLERVPPGMEGEVYVAGNRLADGYLDAEEQTSKRFLRDPKVDRRYPEVYRSGDFARLDDDGHLIPAGRRDHRVKIRGFRLDLSAIQAEIEKAPGISQAVACVEESARAGESQLVAYVVPAANSAIDAGQIRTRLSESLPPQAVPGLILVEADIPTNASGKVDRGALAARRRQRQSPQTRSSSGDELEQSLLSVWEEMLGYRGARLDDDFFAKGGDSLLAISLFVEIEERFSVRLPPSTLFESATVRSLAAMLRSGQDHPRSTPSVLRLSEGGSLPPLFLVHTIWEHLSHFRELVKLLDPDLPVYALEPTTDHREIDGNTDVDLLINKYVSEIRRACPQGPFLLGGWSIGGMMAFAVAAKLEAAGVTPTTLMLIDAASPLLRSKIRQSEKQGPLAWLSHGRRLMAREIKSLKLSPKQQWMRMKWVLSESGRRLREAVRRPPGHDVRERLKQEFRVIVDKYQPSPYRGAVTLFRSEQRAVDPGMDRDLGWSEFVLGEFEIVGMPGDHVSIVIEPQNMRLLASRMTETIDRALEPAAEKPRSSAENPQAAVDHFLEESLKLVGQPYSERAPWNHVATSDAIRQFAFGIADDNPLWSDPDYAAAGPFGRLLAPPTFLVSARYPILHGAPVDAPLLSLLKDVEFTWEKRIFVGDELHSETRQGEVQEVVEPGGNRRIYVEGLTTYTDERGEEIAGARGTVVRMPSQGEFQIDEWSAHEYRSEELQRIQSEILAEKRTGTRVLSEDEIAVGARLPGIVRGPMNIGDMVCWHAAIGPSYRPGPLGYKDILATPHFRVHHPQTAWPIKYMLQHEDWRLAHQRGMPAPFDNGIMRFAWVSPLVTNWMGDQGFLVRLKVTIHLPVLYGDTSWYTGEIVECSSEGERMRVGIRILGTNQKGSITTSGHAEVLLGQPG